MSDNNNLCLLNADRTLYVYKNSMNGWSQVFTGVEFDYTAATQGANHVIQCNLYWSVNRQTRPTVRSLLICWSIQMLNYTWHKRSDWFQLSGNCWVLQYSLLAHMIHSDKSSFTHSFIHIEHLYSASSRKLLRSAPNTSTVKQSSTTTTSTLNT